MNKIIDLSGKRFGRLKVIEIHHRNPNRTYVYLCECDCGKNTTVFAANLRNGSTVSCGCYGKERVMKSNSTHGMTHSRIWRIWHVMRWRCKSNDRKYYNGIGISVCERWNKFENFFQDMGYPPTDNHSIDRINPTGNYEPSNCRWATKYEQANNRRDSLFFEFNGESKTAHQWSNIYGIKADTFLHRIKYGWSIPDALLRPVHQYRR